MRDIESLKKEYKFYKEVLDSIYGIKKISKNKELDSHISYLKGIKKGLKISINSISG